MTLALGIGANTAIFSVVDAVLLKPLPYPEADRLVLVWERNTAIDKERDPGGAAQLSGLAEPEHGRSRSWAPIAFRAFALDDAGEPEQLQALSLSSSVFRVLGANAASAGCLPRKKSDAAIGSSSWPTRCGSAALAGMRRRLAAAMSLNGAAFTIVGVMPADFHVSRRRSGRSVFAADMFTRRRAHQPPVAYADGRRPAEDGRHGGSGDRGLGRIAKRIAAADSTSNPDVTVAGAHDVLVEDVRLGLIVLFGTVGFVLLIACANVANLLMVRAASRRREVAMRAALGAGRGRLLRQLLTESVLLAVIGAAAGVVHRPVGCWRRYRVFRRRTCRAWIRWASTAWCCCSSPLPR